MWKVLFEVFVLALIVAVCVQKLQRDSDTIGIFWAKRILLSLAIATMVHVVNDARATIVRQIVTNSLLIFITLELSRKIVL